MKTLEELRKNHSQFYFDQVVLEHQDRDLLIFLKYHFANGPELTTSWCFPGISPEKLATKDEELIKVWAAHLGMIEGLSYWKAACSPEWIINVPGITAEQFPFWQNILRKGLSEFFFLHEIDGWQENFVHFQVKVPEERQLHPQVNETSHTPRLLIPIGGGKDSVVTAELLRKANLPITTFSVDSYHQPYIAKVIDVFWKNSSERSHLIVQRRLDPQLVELNKQGYLNGHTPFSAMLAFVSTLTAYLYDYQYVPLSNEWSANEGNTVFLGQTINHQYSKTVEFEELFRAHLRKYLSTTIDYFSFLRPLHELQIAKLFTRYRDYWPVFLSCNRGQRKGEWCGECAKCLFVSVMLSAFLSSKELFGIFHKEILNNIKLTDIFDQLAGFTEVKSLDCVGTRDETRAAIALAVRQLHPAPKLIAYGWQKLLEEGKSEEILLARAHKLLGNFAPQHFIPEAFEEILQDAVVEISGDSEKR